MANRLWLKEKFSSFKYTASRISSHVTELEELVLKMQTANCGPSEEDICAVMMRSLPPSYASWVQVFRMAVTSFKFSDMVSQLIAEEARQCDLARIEEAYCFLHRRKWRQEMVKEAARSATEETDGSVF